MKVITSFLILIFFFSCKPKVPIKKPDETVYSIVKDKSGNSYTAVRIGSQTWMTENLITVRYSDSQNKVTDTIRTLINQDSSIFNRLPLNPDTLAYYWKYQGGSKTIDFGKLYTWYAVKNRNVCPQGWHVPTEYDWEKLIAFLGGVDIAGGKMKSIDTTKWEKNNVGATNSSNFNGIGAGYKTEFGSFIDQLKFGMYWSSTEDPNFTDCAQAYALYAGSIKIYKVSKSKKAALSVRCISDK